MASISDVRRSPATPDPPKRSSRLGLLETVAAMDVPFLRQEVADRPVVFVNEPALIQEVLVTRALSFEKSEFQKRVMGVAEGSETGLGNGLLTSSNSTNKHQRKLIGRVFSPPKMRRYVEEMAALTRETRDAWADGDCIETGATFMRLSTRIVAQTLFSWTLGSEDEPMLEMLNLIGKMLGRSADERIEGWDDPTVIERAGSGIESRLMAQVAARRGKALDPENGDVIDILLAAQTEQVNMGPDAPSEYVVTDRQLRDDMMTLFITGAENPRNALSWALYLLSRHPEAARKVRDEIRAADVQDGKITLAALDQLPFTLQVFKETLRLYPPGYAFGRRTVQDVEIGPLKLERETEVVISPYALHRRMGLYEHPNEFIPERFERSREKCLSTYAYLPFGAGPRSCIGGGFSMLEGHVVLAVLFGALTFAAASNEPVLPEPRMTLRPSGPVSVIIRREQGASDA